MGGWMTNRELAAAGGTGSEGLLARRALVLAFAVGIAVLACCVGRALAGDAPLIPTLAAPAPAAGQVTWGTDSNEEANTDRVPVDNYQSHAGAKVLYSLPITDPIASNQPIRIRGEAQLSFCTTAEQKAGNCPNAYDRDS